MKLFLTIALCVGCIFSALAQDDLDQAAKALHLPIDSSTQLVTYGGAVSANNTAEILFNRALEWLDTAFRYSGAALWTADLGTGKIICKESVLDTLPQYAYATLTFTVSIKVENGGYKYKFTNLYFDHVTVGGIPNVPVESMIHPTRKQYDIIVASPSIGGYQSVLNKYLAPIDGLMQIQVASFNHSMTRDMSGDKNTW
jgi:Domain of unknown function (DUF4468) with TBP-like fold